MPIKKRRIVVADDDPQFLKLIKLKLQFENYDVLMACNGVQALELVEQESPEMLILNITMPKMSGFDVCKRVREFSEVPIIFVTAREQLHDKLEGFHLGADDFLVKPFMMEELLVRVHAIFRRAEALTCTPGHMQSSITIGDLTINYTWHQVRMANREIAVTPIEYNLLAYLGRHAGQVLTHYQLLEHVWGNEYVNEQHVLQVNINRLRQKLEPLPSHPRYILTRAGIGYMLAIHPQLNQGKSRGEQKQTVICTEGKVNGTLKARKARESFSLSIEEASPTLQY